MDWRGKEREKERETSMCGAGRPCTPFWTRGSLSQSVIRVGVKTQPVVPALIGDSGPPPGTGPWQAVLPAPPQRGRARLPLFHPHTRPSACWGLSCRQTGFPTSLTCPVLSSAPESLSFGHQHWANALKVKSSF